MTRRHISTRARVGVFEHHNGQCHLCGVKIQSGEEWDISHAIPLAIGGADDETNWLPAHRKCHRLHTSTVDAPRIAKTKRQHAAHIGAKSPSRNPLPGGRNSRWKRKLDGTIVER
jgi:5-methylcytosine-specific restriction enzyme A